MHKSRPAERTAVYRLMTVASLGLFFVAGAYALSRSQLPFATPVYWAGQAIVFLAVARYVLLRRRPGASPEIAVLVYAAAQYLMRWSYSPDQFRFADELQHYRSMVNLLENRHLFVHNYSLPISPQYPALENAAAAIAQVTQASIFTSAVLLVGLAHVLLAGLVVLLYREVTQSRQLASAGALIYALTPNLGFFDASFVYEALALPFLVLAMIFSIRVLRCPTWSWLNVVGCVCSMILVQSTHPVSAIVGCLYLLSMAVILTFDRRRSHALRMSVLAFASVVTFSLWLTFIAPDTIGYLGTDLGEGIGVAGEDGPPRDPIQRGGTPLIERVVSLAGVGVTSVAILATIWKERRGEVVLRAFVLIGASYFAVLALRLVARNGAELATRSLTFVGLFSALSIACGLQLLMRSLTERPLKLLPPPTTTMVPFAVLLLLLSASITTGLPPSWDRLPGKFHIEAVASGIDRRGVEAAKWAAGHIPPGSRIVGDISAITVLATYAPLDPVRDPGALFYRSDFTREDRLIFAQSEIDYVHVDMRMSRDVPMLGKYFPVDMRQGEHTTPIPVEHLTKFAGLTGVWQVYDNGAIKIYDVRGVSRASR